MGIHVKRCYGYTQRSIPWDSAAKPDYWPISMYFNLVYKLDPLLGGTTVSSLACYLHVPLLPGSSVLRLVRLYS